MQFIDLDEFPNVLRWYLSIAARPAVKCGWAVPVPAEVPLPRSQRDD
jgi:glutathione S-transferase